jgi:CheY-like chemotaxis protein
LCLRIEAEERKIEIWRVGLRAYWQSTTQANLDLLTALTSAKYEVITANDGQTALGLVENASADLVLLDVMMPGMSG